MVAGRFEHTDLVFYLHHNDGIFFSVDLGNVLHQPSKGFVVGLENIFREG